MEALLPLLQTHCSILLLTTRRGFLWRSPCGAEGNWDVHRWLPPGKPYGKGRITLCGDGSQPMTPNLGQGGCVALEV